MIQVSDAFAALIDSTPYRLILTLEDGTEVPTGAVKSAEWSGGSNAGDDITLGSTVATALTVTLDRTKLGSIDLADARLTAALTLKDHEDEGSIVWQGLQVDEMESDDDVVTITACDAMIWAFSVQYGLDDTALGFDWETGVDGEILLQAICDACGITLATTGLPAITLQHVDAAGYTYREIIAFLACMWGYFARINGAGELILRWYETADRPVTASRYYDGGLVKANYGYTVGYIKCYVETLEETLCVGDTASAQGIYIQCPWMTQERLERVWEAVGGFSYRPVSDLRFLGDPRLEPGDVLQVTDRDGITYTVPCMSLRHEFDGGLISNITAVGKSVSASKDDYQGPVTRQIERAVAGVRTSITKYIDSIRMEVSQEVGADGKVYAAITLRIGPNAYTGQILIEGNLNVSGQLSADALYALEGDIADLTVNRLSTSRRIIRYLAGDTSDDTYLVAEDEELSYMVGRVSTDEDGNPLTEQAANPNGLPIYWEADPAAEDVVIGTDGYPYLSGVRIYTTTAVTDWPVTVYTYETNVVGKFAFEEAAPIWSSGSGTVYVPVLTLGVGDNNGYNKARIVKGQDGLEISYTATSGKELGVRMGMDGYMDLHGLRQLTKVAITEASDGTVTIVDTLEGDVTETIVIGADESGNPNSLTYNGVAIPLTFATEASA